MAGIGETPEQRQEALRFLEVNRGRFSYDEALRILLHHNWDVYAANNFVWNEPDLNRIREVAGTGRDWHAIQSDNVLRDMARDLNISHADRQFGCGPCDSMWWRCTPVRKPVSKCYRCRVRYKAIPRDKEWGWAVFRCDVCNREFGGFGQMGEASPCYICQNICYPIEVKPPTRRQQTAGRRRHQHSCCAPNCYNRNYPVVPNTFCAHPQSVGRRVLFPSQPHNSTGSTVDTFLPQDHLDNFYLHAMGAISELSD